MFDLDMLSNFDLTGIMAIMEKYKDIDLKTVKIKIEKYDDALIFKILTDSNKAQDVFSDLLPIILGAIPKENLEIIDKRG